MRSVALVLAIGALAIAPRVARAVQVDAMDPLRTWQLRSLTFIGNDAVSKGTLVDAMTTRARRWFAIWRELPPFDPVVFRTDLERLEGLYRSTGYYHARITHDVELPAEGDEVRVTIWIDEGAPLHVTTIDVDLPDTVPSDAPDRATLIAQLPMKPGDVFTEEKYDVGRGRIRAAFRDRGYARVDVAKGASVDVRDDTASVLYTVTPGPRCVFGTTTITGLSEVEEDVVRAEIDWQEGQPFDPKRLSTTESRLRSLRLFRIVRLDEDDSRKPQVDMTVRLTEAPRHEIRFSIGYDTEEQVRGLGAWRSYNFFGGGRQLGFTARISAIRRTIAADFLQPHYPTPLSRTRLLFTQEQDDENTYTLYQTRLAPRVEWNPTPSVGVYGFYRAEFDLLDGVSGGVRKKVPGVAPHTSILSGLAFGVDWNHTDDFLDPTRGFATNATVEPVGGPIGGDITFVRVVGEGRGYLPLPVGFVLATRLRMGAAQPYGNTSVVPLWERFYAGGASSVRGYARRRVGPLTAKDREAGGESLVETSLELRHRITERIGAAVFLDAGQVDLKPWRFPFDSMQLGTGFGVRVRSPIGPLRADLGFPLDPRGRDASWQVYVSVGETF